MSLMAEWTGLEPATPGVTGRYSNQLNYHSARACCPTRRLWWVLRGSNSRPTPCKGAALPTELSTLRAPNLLTVRRVQGHRSKSVYCILQGLASPELRNPRGLDLDRLIGAWVAAKPRRALADHERAEADQRDGIALFQGRTNAADDRFQRATSRRFRDIGLTRDMLDQFGLVHCHPLPSRLVDFFVRIEQPPRAKPAIVSARPRDCGRRVFNRAAFTVSSGPVEWHHARALSRPVSVCAAARSVLDEFPWRGFGFHRFGRRRLGARRRGDLFFGQRDRLARQRDFEQLVDPFDRHDFDPVLHVIRNLREVLHVFLGDQNGLDSAAQCRQQLFLQAADRP